MDKFITGLFIIGYKLFLLLCLLSNLITWPVQLGILAVMVIKDKLGKLDDKDPTKTDLCNMVYKRVRKMQLKPWFKHNIRMFFLCWSLESIGREMDLVDLAWEGCYPE